MSDLRLPPAVRSSRGARAAAIALFMGVVSAIFLQVPQPAVASDPATAAPATIDVNGKRLPNLNGIWMRREGSFMFDPSVRDPLKLQPPYKPEWMDAFDKHRHHVATTGVSSLDPTAGCLPPGMPRMMNTVYPVEILMTPGQVTIIQEWMGATRRVYTDGRKHPEDPDVTFNGHSIGHWEGDTLVIDTVAMKGDTLLDQSGMKHSDQIHVIERMRLIDPQTLENRLTLEDPVAFTHPWTVTRRLKRAGPDEEIREFVCEENNRNPVRPDGTIDTILKGSDATAADKAGTAGNSAPGAGKDSK